MKHLLSLFFFLFTLAATAQVPITAVPAWVTSNTIDLNKRTLDESAQDGYIDLVFEKQIALGAQTSFVHTARRVLTESGVQNASEVSISYDPGYQRIALHSLRIVRGPIVIDRLRSARFSILQQETERSKHIYNGELSAVHALEDVRKGDVIEYSYSITGFNPVFNGRYASVLDTRFSVPVYGVYYKIVVPTGRSLHYKSLNEAATPVTTPTAGGTVYEWRFADRKPLETEDHLPGWYDPYPMVQVSEYASWQDVSDWALALFPFNEPDPSVAKLAAKLRAQHGSAEAAAVAAIRFVQDDVRYLGIEMGAGSHRPHAPAAVLAQRFGDCKDKSYLLCTLLRSLGFEAWPVLTASGQGKGIRQGLPAPFAFDHCTVQARVGGREIWIDPTIAGQRGGIDNIAYPDYGVGLVVRAGTRDLTDIALQDKGRVHVKETIRMKNLEGAANLHVETVYTGSFADDMRQQVRENSRADLLKQSRKYYLEYFENITADSIRWSDDEEANRFTVFEDHSLGDVWVSDDGRRKLSVFPFVVNSYLHRPDKAKRTMPYALSYPVRITEDVTVELPDDWDAEPEKLQFRSGAFVFDMHTEVSGDRARFHYDLEVTKDHILPSELDEYLSAFKRLEEEAGYRLTYDPSSQKRDGAPKKAHYEPLTIKDVYPLLYVLLGVAVFATWVIRRNRR